MEAVPTAVNSQARPISLERCCPHCGGTQTDAHGSFTLKDGTRVSRRLCRPCGRTFNQNTGTAIAYIKKRAEWVENTKLMNRHISLRSVARRLHVWLSTAHRWRP